MLRKSISTIAVLLLVVSSVFALPERREALKSGTFIIEPGYYNYVTFDVGRRGAQVQGRFRARGGSGNDVIVFITDEDGFENWRNKHNHTAYYHSGRATAGTINVGLGEGKYILVFSNTFSSVSNKAVTANIDLIY